MFRFTCGGFSTEAIGTCFLESVQRNWRTKEHPPKLLMALFGRKSIFEASPPLRAAVPGSEPVINIPCFPLLTEKNLQKNKVKLVSCDLASCSHTLYGTYIACS
jgi:hypothetical protein